MSDELPDPFEIARRYQHLRVADVCDALDGLGYFGIGLLDAEIRPLFEGMRFWGPALTVRCVPANRPMWKLDTTDEVVASHDLWFATVGHAFRMLPEVREGHVIVTDTGGAGEVGYWGSNSALRFTTAGAVGIVTDGQCRDSDELIHQQTPICSRGRGRTILPGRLQMVETQTRISCGGVHIKPGDIVGCDGDGVVAVPLHVARDVATHAVAVLLADMRARLEAYEEAGIEPDSTVDVAAIEHYYRQFD